MLTTGAVRKLSVTSAAGGSRRIQPGISLLKKLLCGAFQLLIVEVISDKPFDSLL